MDNPFEITLYSKTFARTGWINDPTELKITVRHNGIGTTLITLPSSHRQLPNLEADGSRAVITYRGEHLMSGYITEGSGQGPSVTGEFTFTLQDDLWLLWRILGWPVPGADIDSQGTKQDTRTGPAETVAKGFVTANLAHNTVDPIQVATSLGRGSNITASSRMAVLAESFIELVDKAGIGLSAKQVGTKIVLDAYVPKVYIHTLSEEAGTITNWSWSKANATMTRAIAGGPNENTSREFKRTISTSRETALGYTIEGFVDAKSAENTAAILAANDAALAEAGPKAGFSVELSESDVFRYGGQGVHVGDQVTVKIGTRTMTDILREASFSWTQSQGLEITPTIGERSDDPTRSLVKFVAAGLRGLRELRTR